MSLSLASVQHSILWGAGVHHLDALRYILAKNVARVMAESFTLPWGQLPPGASIRVMLSMEDDARASYSATYESSGHEFFERGQEFYLRFVGERVLPCVQRGYTLRAQQIPRLRTTWSGRLQRASFVGQSKVCYGS